MLFYAPGSQTECAKVRREPWRRCAELTHFRDSQEPTGELPGIPQAGSSTTATLKLAMTEIFRIFSPWKSAGNTISYSWRRGGAVVKH